MIDFRYATKEEIDNLNEKDFDAYLDWLDSVPRKKTNSRKSLLPLYLYVIKTENPKRGYTQKQLIRILDMRYGISVERKAVSRALHLLEEEGLIEGSHSYSESAAA